MLKERGFVKLKDGELVVKTPNISDAYTTENQVYSLISFMRDGQMQAFLTDAGIKVHSDFILRHLNIPKRTGAAG